MFVTAARGTWEQMLQPAPRPFYQDLLAAAAHHGVLLNSDLLEIAAYYPALRRLFGDPPRITGAVMARFDKATGRYLHLSLNGIDHRVYFEESGTGIPLLLQHTAGADGRQWRHLLEDEGITRHFRCIAYDLPYHGKSLPPVGPEWWAEEYRLTRDFLMQVPMPLAEALALTRPVFMGSSIGGHLALDLARYHPELFRAVIALEGAAATPGSYLDVWNHPRVSNAFKANVMYGLMSPTSPEGIPPRNDLGVQPRRSAGVQGRPVLSRRRSRLARRACTHRHLPCGGVSADRRV